MSLQFIFGNSGSGKSEYGFRYIIEKAMRHPERRFLVVVPEQFTMQTQKTIVSMHPDGGILNIDVLSFQRLAYRIFEETGGELRPLLSETGKTLVLQRIAQEQEKNLKVLGQNLKRHGAVAKMKSLVSELMQYQVTGEDLELWRERAKGKPLLALKLQDIGCIYQAFEEYLRDSYVTPEGVLEVLTAKLEQSEKIRTSEILFDGFVGFTPIQLKVLKELMALSPRLLVTVTMDERENPVGRCGPQNLFFASKKMVRQLLDRAQEVHCEVLPEVWARRGEHSRFRKGSALDFLEQHLYRYDKEQWERTPDDELSIRVMVNPQEELRAVAGKIHELVRAGEYRYREIAVISGDLSSYASYARQIFRQAGIPCFIDEKHTVLMNPFVEFLRAALDLVVQDFSYESVFRYLRCGMGCLSREETDELENYVIALGIRGFQRYRETWTRCYRGMKPEELLHINELRRRFLEEVEAFAQGMKQRRTPVLFKTKTLYEFIVKSDCQRKLERQKKMFQDRGEAAMAREYAQIYGIVMELLDKLVEVLGDEAISLSDYQEILEAGFQEAQVAVIPPSADQVLIGDNERTRLKNIRVLFFVGVNEGLIPRHTGFGGILSEPDREELKRNQAELSPTSREEMYMQRFYLYLNLTKPSEKLYLSYCRTNAKGESLMPSYLIGSFRKMFPKLKVLEAGEVTASPETPLDALPAFLEGLHQAAEGQAAPEFLELYRWYKNHPEAGIPADDYVEAVFYRNPKDVIGKTAAHALYGQVLTNSATRLERYAACAFAHFMEYGLRLQERVQYEFKANDMGSVMHEALEQFSRLLEKQGLEWKNLDEEERDRLIDESVEAVIGDYGNTILQSSSRNRYMILRVKRILRRTVWALQEQLKKGSFTPGAFEVSFAMEDSLDAINITLSDEEKLRLRGRIDRMDVCEKDDTVYVKIIDYKSGNTSLDLVALYYGLQLQLVVYMDAALELEEKKHPGKDVEPAGIFYYHIGDPMLEKKDGETDEAWNRRLLAALKMDGLVNADPEVVALLDHSVGAGASSDVVPVGYKKDGSFSSYSKVATREEFFVIRKYTELKIRETGRGILDGNAEAAPYQLGAKNACTFCAYSGICGFDQRLPGFQYRKLKTLDDFELIKAMQEDVETWE